MAVMPALITGARLVMYKGFSPANWLGWVRSSGATHTNLVGVMVDWVLKQPATESDADNRLRCVCAVPTPALTVGEFRTRFGIADVVEVYGSTESTLPVVTPPFADRPAGAAGICVDQFYDVRLVDEHDEDVPVGQVGELLVRPRYPFTTTLGYFGMPDKTAEAFRNLWFHTGDALRRDDAGWYYFVDRLKDAIRRRGENISSFEVEQAVVGHDDVLECAVIAVPADGEGAEDEVMAFVVARPGGSLSPDDVWKWADHQLPAFMVPRYLAFVDGLPKTPSERVQKGDLREVATATARHDRLDTT
jgi:crotonobetaine/carnitine-CoA ligase